MSRVSRIGHRGAGGHAPENTLAAIRKGIELGVDFVEFDIHRTADGALVAIHDATINRTTNGRGRVDALSLDRLRGFDAGNDERIPTVEEILKVASGRTGVMMELKAAGTAHLSVEAVRKAKFGNPVIYASFLHEELADVRAVAPDSAVMPLFDKLPRSRLNSVMAYRPAYVGLRHDRVRQELVQALHEQHVLVWVYTANSRAEISRALAAGVDGVISDFPERIPLS